ncbi:hypothetical protein HMPREF1545_03751 [Oscillibacter sp. KLE 1728]|nr:hypothetical protein HMPREF1545_03751 [Oscillibacter sp. KLE 1728]ERK64581.1 hypothetical protein HMPREF1546_01658 [Oscillibacter sp. KLE 1745]
MRAIKVLLLLCSFFHRSIIPECRSGRYWRKYIKNPQKHSKTDEET